MGEWNKLCGGAQSSPTLWAQAERWQSIFTLEIQRDGELFAVEFP